MSELGSRATAEGGQLGAHTSSVSAWVLRCAGGGAGREMWEHMSENPVVLTSLTPPPTIKNLRRPP